MQFQSLPLGDFDRKHAMPTVKGKGSKERGIALGKNCLRNLLYYLDRHRPGDILSRALADKNELGIKPLPMWLRKN